MTTCQLILYMLLTKLTPLVTMPDFAYARVMAGELMPGVFVVHDRLAVGQAIKELLLIEACSDQAEWAGLVVYLPW